MSSRVIGFDMAAISSLPSATSLRTDEGGKNAKPSPSATRLVRTRKESASSWTSSLIFFVAAACSISARSPCE